MIVITCVAVILVLDAQLQTRGIDSEGVVGSWDLLQLCITKTILFVCIPIVIIVARYKKLYNDKSSRSFDYLVITWVVFLVSGLTYQYNDTSVTDRYEAMKHSKEILKFDKNFESIIIKWNEVQKEELILELRKNVLENMPNAPKETIDKYAKCCADKITKKYTPNQIQLVSKLEVQKIYLMCINELENK